MRKRWPTTGACCERHSSGMAGSRWIRKVTRSSLCFRLRPVLSLPPRRGRRRSKEGPIRVRMGMHTGTPILTDEGYVGADVHRAARIAAAGSGGQVLLSRATRDLVDAEVRDLGEHRLKDLSAPERIFQLGGEQVPAV